MRDIKMLFSISIIDKRNDGPFLHSANFLLNQNDGIWRRLLTQNEDVMVAEFLKGKFFNGKIPDLEERSVVDYLNQGVGGWEDLLNQSVDDTVRNMLIELIQMRNIPESPDSLFQGDLSFWWEVGNTVEIPFVRIPYRVASTSLGDLIEKFKLNHKRQNEMFVGSVLFLK